MPLRREGILQFSELQLELLTSPGVIVVKKGYELPARLLNASHASPASTDSASEEHPNRVCDITQYRRQSAFSGIDDHDDLERWASLIESTEDRRPDSGPTHCWYNNRDTWKSHQITN